MRTAKQRKLYLDEARRAYETVFDPDDATAPTLEAWRRQESRYSCGKSWSDGLTNGELSAALCNFRYWRFHRRRATAEEIAEAVRRNRGVGLAGAARRAVAEFIATFADAEEGRRYVNSVLLPRWKLLSADDITDALVPKDLSEIATTFNNRANDRRQQATTKEPL